MNQVVGRLQEKISLLKNKQANTLQKMEGRVSAASGIQNGFATPTLGTFKDGFSTHSDFC